MYARLYFSFVFKQVIIEDMETKQKNEFLCNQWLAKDEGDGLTSRELSCGGDAAKSKPVMKKQSVIETDVSQTEKRSMI